MASPLVKLSSGYSMPIVGLGTYDDLKDDKNAEAVANAISVGYRHIDTAWLYLCESSVGKGIARKIKDGTVKREELFIVSKLYNTCHTRAEAAVKESLSDLGLDYLDLYLIHWPIPFKEMGRPTQGNLDELDIMKPTSFLEGHDIRDTWRSMEKLQEKGLVRSIGLSNFNEEQINYILTMPGLKFKPACIQLESHPYFTNEPLVEFCKSVNIVPIGFAPLGRGGVDYAGNAIGNIFDEPLIKNLADKYKRTPGQIVLRWNIERGLAIVPKSTNPERIKGNIQLFDFKLSPKEVTAISSLNKNNRVCHFTEWRNLPTFPFVDIKARHGIV